MQLTKDDVEWINGVKYIAVSKLHQVIKFYKKNKKNPSKKLYKKFFDEKERSLIPSSYGDWLNQTSGYANEFQEWLFNHCFVRGLE